MCGGTPDYWNNSLPSAFARHKRELAIRQMNQAKLACATEKEITRRDSDMTQDSASTQELVVPNSKKGRLSRSVDRFCVKLGI